MEKRRGVESIRPLGPTLRGSGGGRRVRSRAGRRLSPGPAGRRAGALLFAFTVAVTFGLSRGLAIQEPDGGGVVEADRFRIVYPRGHRVTAEALARSMQRPRPLPGLPEDVLAGPAVTVYLAADPASFERLSPGAPDWSGGIAFPSRNRIVLPLFDTRTGDRPLPVVLQHELAHVALGRYLGPNVPRWFHEGYAQVAAGSWTTGDAWALRLAILAGRLPRLDSLHLGFPEDRVSAEEAYLLSYTAVEELRRLGGPDGFAALLESWRATGDIDRAIRRTYGLTLWQFERLWRETVRDRYGWLLVLSQTIVFWTVLTIVLLVLGYWKKRRDRRKLEELRAREVDYREPFWAEYPPEDSSKRLIDGPGDRG